MIIELLMQMVNELIDIQGASIRYKKGPAIRYKKGPSIRYIGQKFRDFFLKGFRYKVYWSVDSRKNFFFYF